LLFLEAPFDVATNSSQSRRKSPLTANGAFQFPIPIPASHNLVHPSCLHFRRQVLKIGSLKKSMTFFENVLGLKVLRHEEFDEGCEATCNGPYGGEQGTSASALIFGRG